MTHAKSRALGVGRGSLLFAVASAALLLIIIGAWELGGRPDWLTWPARLVTGLGLVAAVIAAGGYTAAALFRPAPARLEVAPEVPELWEARLEVPELQEVRRNPRTVIVEAPTVEGVTLYHWLIQRHPREHREHRRGVWGQVVTEFFDLELADAEIRARFDDVADMDEFQSHFLAALNILTNTGLTVGTLNVIREKHAGRGITGGEFDRTLLNMIKVLDSKKVPDKAIQQLGKAVAELRPVVVGGGTT
jgi:truncated hemoglobin YjbI